MKYSGAYGIVLALHLLTVAFVVGPAAFAASASGRLAKQGRVDALRDAGDSTRKYTIATLATVLLGMGLVGLGDVGDQWSYGQPWISASFVLAILAIGLVLVLVVPAQQAAADALAEERDAGSALKRLSIGAGLASLCWAIVIVLMVLKPGA
jgi:hypothetical protein